MDDALQRETERLRWAWDKFPSQRLDTYLVSDVEDPRINAQSILTRALIADTLFPGQFTGLIEAEWRFGLCHTWLTQCLRQGHTRREILQRIEGKDDAACPEFLIHTYEFLQSATCPFPDYITEALLAPDSDDGRLIPDNVLDTFASFWNRTLALYSDATISVVEPACGSANDYRYLVGHGLARFLKYRGFDLSRKNIANAQRRFPDTVFFVGNAIQIPMDDGACDYLFVHDLFEHLSPDAFEIALAEVLRVTRKEAWLSFFNMDAIPDHQFLPVEDYHWNTLSQTRTVETILRHAGDVEVVNIAELLRKKFEYATYYNPHAKTLMVTI